ncbi:hypothetical protein SODALDRAFT_182125 [Sodiomyces alkalinus F11]|uniref:Uncharacterized protein n=1 Tax=Sodiomyces alkalinus (strain CBS 110278 / VKM F-3762 / F11) TaxID=1314773 RepID=A0A3N2PUE8_SODAK|nr:hypothetical protein SODALDRAFT_182125 [Sodiomyces alkalinus F11]ROT38111.1 hypothetical protein SODALDRAFT_182125 [Sodiomyces alkalinus F11]
MVVDVDSLRRDAGFEPYLPCLEPNASCGDVFSYQTDLPSPLSLPPGDDPQEREQSEHEHPQDERVVPNDSTYTFLPCSPPASPPSPPLSQTTPDISTPEPEAFPFSLTLDVGASDFHFAPVPSYLVLPSYAAKRYRAASDVDGPNTASLSWKKRRLRHQLITSRLSQPFSLPATHIINREAVAAGDKRFMKLAASASASKRCTSVQSSIIRRAALLNSVRSRLQNELTERGEVLLTDAAAQTTMLHRGQQAATGGRFFSVAAMPGHDARGGVRPRVVLVRPCGGGGGLTTTTTTTTTPSAGVCQQRLDGRPASPAPSVLKVAENAARRVSKSPHLRPMRSPVLGPADAGPDEVGDDEIAFPGDDSRYTSGDEDESGDVYCDFAAIFGGPPESDSSDDESYEECLDELDGISWVGR